MKRIKLYICLFLVLIEMVSLFLTMKSLSNKPIEEINEINEVNKKQFSMFISDEEGNYTEYTESNIFPEGYQINLENSKCIDTKGNVIDGILSGNGTNITVTSTKTSYCYLYFDIEEPSAAEYLIENVDSSVLWNSTLEDDGYRYVGTDPDNYICFGTTDSNTCTSNTDLYMYRIIGIFEDSEGIQHLKLIKKESLNTSYPWDNDYVNENDWDNSFLYIGINDSLFLNNQDFGYMQNNLWLNKIIDWEYTATNTKSYEIYYESGVYGIHYSRFNTAGLVYLHEMNRSSKSNYICYYLASNTNVVADCTAGEWKNVIAKVGLMYVSDFLLSLGNISYNSYDNKTELNNGWMHISNNDSSAPSSYEWTMSRYGFSNSSTFPVVWAILAKTGYAYSVGNYMMNQNGTQGMGATRPVFYLKSDVTISGEGTTTNPYIITN